MRAVKVKTADFIALSAVILEEGSSLRFEAHGSCMYPFIHDGDILTVQPARAETLRLGEIAFYRTRGDQLAAHRIIRLDAQEGRVWLTTRGDASLDGAELVVAEQVLGRVVDLQRGAKVVRLDQGFQKWLALLWIKLASFGVPGWLRFIKNAAVRLLCQLQGLKLYRTIARQFIQQQVRYRLASFEDVPALARFYAYDKMEELENPVETFAGQIEDLKSSGFTLVAELGDQIAGAAIIQRCTEEAKNRSGWWLFGMLVRQRYRGSGIGEGLVRFAQETVIDEHASHFNLLVFEHNRAAVNLYTKLGFRAVSIPKLDGQLAEEARRGLRRISMSKPL